MEGSLGVLVVSIVNVVAADNNLHTTKNGIPDIVTPSLPETLRDPICIGCVIYHPAIETKPGALCTNNGFYLLFKVLPQQTM